VRKTVLDEIVKDAVRCRSVIEKPLSKLAKKHIGLVRNEQQSSTMWRQ